jgi:aromatic ring-opening dioxygenase catalytic subunit (LigB family)
MPAVLAAQGAPPLVDHPGWTAELGAWGRSLPRPRAILVVSAHWGTAPARARADDHPGLRRFDGLAGYPSTCRIPAAAVLAGQSGG